MLRFTGCCFFGRQGHHGADLNDLWRTIASQLCLRSRKAAPNQHTFAKLPCSSESCRTSSSIISSISVLIYQAGATLYPDTSRQVRRLAAKLSRPFTVLQATDRVSCAATQESTDCHPSVRDRFMSVLMACAAAASVAIAFPASSAFAEQQPFLSSTGVLPQLAGRL